MTVASQRPRLGHPQLRPLDVSQDILRPRLGVSRTKNALSDSKEEELSFINRPINQNLLKTSVDEVRHQGAVVSSNCFNPFAIHLVMNFRLRKVKSGVAFLVDQEIRKINLRYTHKGF